MDSAIALVYILPLALIAGATAVMSPIIYFTKRDSDKNVMVFS